MKVKEIMDDLNGNTRRRSSARVAVGTSIGVMVGAAAGMMLAPKSGKGIRMDMKHGAEWSAEKVSEAAGKAAKFVKKGAASANETVTDVKEDMSHAVNKVIDKKVKT